MYQYGVKQINLSQHVITIFLIKHPSATAKHWTLYLYRAYIYRLGQ